MKYVIGILLLVGFLFSALWGKAQYDRNSELGKRLDTQITINDSTEAILARTRRERNALSALVDAERSMRGELEAGLRIVTVPETVYVAPTDRTTVLTDDSTRFATIHDTTQMGVELTVTAVAPPFPLDLQIGYEVVVPSFTPEIGFIRDGDEYTAVVSWQGVEYSIENAFHAPPPRLHRPKMRIVAGTETGGLEGLLRVPDTYFAIKRRVPLFTKWEFTTKGTFHGAARTPSVSFGLERTLFEQ